MKTTKRRRRRDASLVDNDSIGVFGDVVVQSGDSSHGVFGEDVDDDDDDDDDDDSAAVSLAASGATRIVVQLKEVQFKMSR